MRLSEMTDRLIILNLPHPNGFLREMASNKEQQTNSSYARKFQQGSVSDPDIFFGRPMNPQTISKWVKDEDAKMHYVEAFERSYFEGMLNYYKQNYPPLPQLGDDGATATAPMPALPKVSMPVLMFHGLDDKALLSDGLNNTWDWLEKDLTLVTIPGAGHFVQQDAAELVSKTMKWWLLARQ
jgi:pimeloyl-ACP methyl ester carboxylesterase